jgi:arsenite-transporting ATPase
VNPKRVREVEIDATEWPTLTTPLTLTVGKGGVGKTTVSAALAFHQRKNKPREQVTICSTDPAPSLDDIFQADVGDAAVPVLGDRKLLAVEIDSVAQFRAWANRVRSKLTSALSGQSGGVHADLTLERNVLEALLDIVPPGVDELFAVFRMLNLLESGAARVVIDMAPTGHALELLRMPERMKQWSRLLLKSLAPHRTLPLARDLAVEIAEIEQQVRKLASMLHDASRVSVVPVMLAEPLPDRETERLLAELGRMGAPVAPLVVNRVLVRAPAGCPRCRRARAWQMATLAGLARRHEKLYVAPNQPGEVSGRAALQAFTSHLWQAEPRRSRKRA